MEWVAEGLTLIFLGILVLIIEEAALIAAIMLIVMALLSLFTGARTKVIFFKLCHIIKTIVAVLWIVSFF